MEPGSGKDIKFLNMALGVATQSKARYKHGALVVRHSHVLGASPNVVKNDPRYVDHQHSSIHAEIAAMKKAGWPRRATVYVARVNSYGKARLSKPCATCQEVLDAHKCKVVWTQSENS